MTEQEFVKTEFTNEQETVELFDSFAAKFVASAMEYREKNRVADLAEIEYRRAMLTNDCLLYTSPSPRDS